MLHLFSATQPTAPIAPLNAGRSGWAALVLPHSVLGSAVSGSAAIGIVAVRVRVRTAPELRALVRVDNLLRITFGTTGGGGLFSLVLPYSPLGGVTIGTASTTAPTVPVAVTVRTGSAVRAIVNTETHPLSL